jgi:hypothetical protein
MSSYSQGCSIKREKAIVSTSTVQWCCSRMARGVRTNGSVWSANTLPVVTPHTPDCRT